MKLSNSRAITCVPRLDLDYFESQSDSSRLNQRLPWPNPCHVLGFSDSILAFTSLPVASL